MAGRLVPFEYPSRRNLWFDPWGTNSPAPLRLFEQNFGLGLRDEDLSPPTLFRGWYVRPHQQQTAAQETSGSQVSNSGDNFTINLDVTHFKPEEIGVKVLNTRVMVEGKHEEREDDHGVIQRYFKRAYTLPTDVDPASVKSSLSADGILTIAAPKRAPPEMKQVAIIQPNGDDKKQ
ncbi:Protein lethal(2)essential for life [Lamellibrachia satsuma]|nr:Protein lethal(2)essential for life [Lamellibrachia satsuma]